MAASTVTVGVIGLGSMGLGVARTLCRAGFETWGFDVRDASVLEFEEAGGQHWQLVPSLNSNPQWVEAVAGMIRRN